MKSLTSLMVLVCLNTATIGNELTYIIDSGRCVGTNRKEVIECNVRRVLYGQNLDPFVVELLVAQSKHESGNYTNSLTKYNNLFGRHHHKTDKYSLGAGAPAEGHSRFARYPSVEAATLSQLEYLRRKGYSFKWTSAKEFALELKAKKYYEASVSVYTHALERFIIQSEDTL
jgi:hypothetical protein